MTNSNKHYQITKIIFKHKSIYIYEEFIMKYTYKKQRVNTIVQYYVLTLEGESISSVFFSLSLYVFIYLFNSAVALLILEQQSVIIYKY